MGVQINQLSQAQSLNLGDLIAIFSLNNGDARSASLSLLVSFIQSQLTSGGSFLTKYASPNATGFTVATDPVTNGGDVYLLLTPLAGYAAGTLQLPLQQNCVDGQQLLVSCTQAVTALTVNGNGSTVNGAPTSLTANGFFRLRYDGVNKSWYRIG